MKSAVYIARLRAVCRNSVRALALLLLVASLSHCSESERVPGHHTVGVTTTTVIDAAFAQPLITEIWYPAKAPAKEETLTYGAGYVGLAKRDAKPDTSVRHPLVLVSHGWRGSRYGLSWLAEYLAAEGYVVAAVDQPGSSASDYDDSQAPKVWVRASILHALLDGLLRLPNFERLIDSSRIAAMGHSAGGSAALVLGGARVDRTRFDKLFPQAAPYPRGSWADPRIHAVIAIAPGTGPAFAQKGLRALKVPTLIITGEADKVAPNETNGGYYAANIQGSQWRNVKGAGHYTFGPQCTLYGGLRAKSICFDDAEPSRTFVHAETAEWVKDFLTRNLVSHPPSRSAPTKRAAR